MDIRNMLLFGLTLDNFQCVSTVFDLTVNQISNATYVEDRDMIEGMAGPYQSFQICWVFFQCGEVADYQW